MANMFETIIPEKKYYIGNTCVSFTVNDINNMFQNEEPFDELLMMSFGTIFYEYDEKEDFMYYEQNPLVMRFDDEDKKINIDGEYGAVPDLLFTEIYCRLLYDDLNGSNLGHWLFVAVYRDARNIVIVEGTERKTDIRQRYEKHLDDMLRHIGWRDDDEERNYKYNQVSMSNRQEKRKIDNLSNDSWMISHVLIPSKDSEFLCGPVSLAALEYCCEHDHDWSSFRRSMNLEKLKESVKLDENEANELFQETFDIVCDENRNTSDSESTVGIIDHFECHSKGRLFSGYGKNDDDQKFCGGALFVDHASGYVHVEFQRGHSSHETVESVIKFENHFISSNNFLLNVAHIMILTSVRESSSSSPSSHESSPSLLGGLDRKTLVILKLVAFLFVGMSSPSMGGMEARSFGSVITG